MEKITKKGFYISPWLAGIVSTLLCAMLLFTASNVWFLNGTVIELLAFKRSLETDKATLPGSLPRVEFDLYKQLINQQNNFTNTQLTDMKGQLQEMNRKLEIAAKERDDSD